MNYEIVEMEERTFAGVSAVTKNDSPDMQSVIGGLWQKLYSGVAQSMKNRVNRKYEYLKGLNGHFEIALYVDTFEEVDSEYAKAVEKGAQSVLEPTTELWGQRTCYIADPEGNLIEIGSFNKPFRTFTE